MKQIYWNAFGREILFSVNWFEYWILKRIFNKRKYKILSIRKLRGLSMNLVVVDEAVNCDIEELTKLGRIKPNGILRRERTKRR